AGVRRAGRWPGRWKRRGGPREPGAVGGDPQADRGTAGPPAAAGPPGPARQPDTVDLTPMKPRLSPKAALAALLAVLLAGCASMPPPDIHRDGAYRQRPADAARAGGTADANGPSREEDDEGPRARIRRGSGQLINQVAAAVPPRHVGGTTGQAEFNFEGE